MRSGLAEILTQMELQFSIQTGFFDMGVRELRSEEHPEIITRPGMNVLEWLSLATKLENVSPESMQQLDAFCAFTARGQEIIHNPSYRIKRALRSAYAATRRRFNPAFGRF